MTRTEEIEQSIYKAFRKTVWDRFEQAVQTYHLISEGDRIAVCISGGKDSMLLAKCMQRLQKKSFVNFEVKYLVMDPGYSPEDRKQIIDNLNLLDIPAEIFDSDIFADTEAADAEYPCFLCARMRRGHLYGFARELGCNKIALGHHFDDMIETVVMSMLYSAEIKTMMPKLRSTSFEGMEVIRPLYFVKERDIIDWAKSNDLIFLQCACPRTEGRAADGPEAGRRSAVKAMIAALRAENPQVDANIFESVHNVNLKTLPGYTDLNGQYHNFLDAYEGRYDLPQAAVFDLDGTLLDSMGVWDTVAADYLTAHGITPPADIYNDVCNLTVENAVKYLNGRFGIESPVEEGIAQIHGFVAESYEKAAPKPGADAYLRLLKSKGIPFCLATASDRAYIQPALKRLGWENLFDFIVYAGELPAEKDNPLFYETLCGRLRKAPAQVTVFEDALYAVQSAKKAGCRVVAVADDSAGRERSRIRVLCDFYAGSFEKLLEKI